MNYQKIRRGDIFYADLNPVVGCEQGGIRPVLIIQNDKGNDQSRTTIVAPITKNCGSCYLPVHVFILGRLTGLYENSCVLLEQLRAIDKCRLREKTGCLSPVTMKQIDAAIRISVGLKTEYNRRE